VQRSLHDVDLPLGGAEDRGERVAAGVGVSRSAKRCSSIGRQTGCGNSAISAAPPEEGLLLFVSSRFVSFARVGTDSVRRSCGGSAGFPLDFRVRSFAPSRLQFAVVLVPFVHAAGGIGVLFVDERGELPAPFFHAMPPTVRSAPRWLGRCCRSRSGATPPPRT
jgi:hypothetical protein